MLGHCAWVVGAILITAAPVAPAAEPPLAEYFRTETARIAARPLGGIDSAEAWTARRPELQRQLREMLGLDPMPDRTDLAARVTGTVERADFVIEKVLYQSRPGLYVTANLYRPKVVHSPLPAILYVCGHSKVEKDGVIYGCKAHYQHHASWYAANGYVCLVLDTLQLGELPGLHHGTYREGMWWWQTRGYTPAGVEAWNGIRGIDYLISRPEVDKTKIGVTGRSGGGATSWWIGALDDRVAAVVPVAGITDLRDHVVVGVVEGHCDCMYPVNTGCWDFPLVAALVAPKPLLVENTDKDPIFPEDGVRRIYAQLEKVYAWHHAADRLGLVIGKGGHVDSVEIRHPSFAFFETWLKGKKTEPADIVEPDRSIPIEELKVLKPGEVPPGNRNDTIHETFVAQAEVPPIPKTAQEWEQRRALWMEALRTKVFAGWPRPEEETPLAREEAEDVVRDGIRLRPIEFTSQTGVRLRLWLFSAAGGKAPDHLTLLVLDAWQGTWSDTISAFEGEAVDRREDESLRAVKEAIAERGAHAILAPRGIGPTSWPPEKETHLRRRFALLGQTLDGMRIWDIRRALATLRALPDLRGTELGLSGTRQSASWAFWAAVFEPEVCPVTLDRLPASGRETPALLNLDRVLGMPQALALLYPRPVSLARTPAEASSWARGLAAQLSPGEAWPEVLMPQP